MYRAVVALDESWRCRRRQARQAGRQSAVRGVNEKIACHLVGGLVNSFPFSYRASLGCHAEFCPRAASALATAARGVECLRVPFGTGAARCFSVGECFGWRGGEACASETVRGTIKCFQHFWRHENVILIVGTG